jgi:PAS domain-containing protein
MAAQPTIERLKQKIKHLESQVAVRTQTIDQLQKSKDKYKTLYEKTRNSEKIYRSIIDSSADAIAIFDLNGRAKYVSPSFTKVFGWSMEEVEGKPIPFYRYPKKEKLHRADR